MASISLIYPSAGSSQKPKIEEIDDKFIFSFTSFMPGYYKVVSK